MPTIDGFFIDGTTNSNRSLFANVSDARYMQLIEAQADMLADVQSQLDSRGNGQFILNNGLDTDLSAKIYMRDDATMLDHFAILQFIDRETGEILPEPMEQLYFQTLQDPLLRNRTVQFKGWPGPIIAQRDKWPNNTAYPQPVTLDDFRRDAADQFNNALSYFLLVAEPNYWWSYSWFWHMADLIPTVQDSTVPAEFYPQLQCQLGPPKGPVRKLYEHVYERQYEYARVHVDLTNRKASYVIWLGKCP